MAALPAVPEREVAEFCDELDEMFGKHNKYRKSSMILMEKLAPLSSTPPPAPPAPPVLSSEAVPIVLSFTDDEVAAPKVDELAMPAGRDRSWSDETDMHRKPLNWKEKLARKFSFPAPKLPVLLNQEQQQFVDKGKEKECLEILFTRYSYGGTMMGNQFQTPAVASSSKPSKARRKPRRISSSDPSIVRTAADELKKNPFSNDADDLKPISSSRRSSRG